MIPQKKMNILIVKNKALGDSIMGLSSLSYIKSILSNCKITYALPKWIVPLYSDTNSAADEFFSLELNSFADWFKVFFSLRKKKFDVIIELHQAGRSGNFFKLFSKLTGIPYYYHRHEMGAGNVLDQGIRKAAIQRDLDGIWTHLRNLNWLKENNQTVPNYLSYPPEMGSKRPVQKRNLIVLGVSAGRKTKMWPLPYFKQLVDILLKQDESLEFLIPLSQNQFDEEIKRELMGLNFSSRAQILTPPLSELPALISQGHTYIGNDTGPKHLSLALGLKTITFFGPEEPLEWHPYDSKKHPFLFRENLECRTRVSHYCLLKDCDSMICLNEFSAQTVADLFFNLKNS